MASTITCRRRKRARCSTTTRSGGAISSSRSTAIPGIARSRPIISATGAVRRRRLSPISSRTASAARLNNYEIYSLDGEPCVDFLGRFETLEEDFRRALGEIGLAFEHELPRAKAGIRKNGKHYRDYYDDHTRAVVGEWYAREIKLLGYSF